MTAAVSQSVFAATTKPVVTLAHALFVVGCAAIALAWQLPGHYPPWVAFQQELVSAAGGGLIAWAVVLLSPHVHWPPLARLALAVAAIPLAQRGFGLIDFNSDAALASLYMVSFALALVAGATLARRTDASAFTGPLMAAIAAAAIASTGLALMQWLGSGMPNLWVGALAPRGRPYANFAQPNHLATLLSMGIAAFFFGYETRRVGAAASAIGVAFLGFGVVMTQSRTAFLFLATLLVGSVLLRKRANLRISLVALLAGSALFVVGVLLWGPLNDAVLLSAGPSLESRLQPGVRSTLWPMMLAASLHKPWLGWGWTQSGQAQLHAALDFEPTHYMFKNAHNLVLDLALWNGWPLALLFSAALVCWFALRLSRCRSGAQWALVVAASGVWWHAMVEYPLDYAYFLIPVGLLMGLADNDTEHKPPASTARFSLAAPLALACILAGWIAVEYTKVEESMRTFRFVTARVGLDKVNSVPRPDVRLLDGQLAFFDFAQTTPRAGMSDSELAWMKKVVDREPHSSLLFRYASALALNGRQQEATAVLGRLCRMTTATRCIAAGNEWREMQVLQPAMAAVVPPTPSLR